MTRLVTPRGFGASRIRKQVWNYVGSEPDPVYEGDNPSWQLESDEFYPEVSGQVVRDG